METASSPLRPRPSRAVWIVFLVLLAISLLVVLRMMKPFFEVICLALAAAAVMTSAYQRLSGRFGGRRQLAAAVICLLMVLAVLGPLVTIMTVVSREALDFYEMTTVELAERSMLERLRENQEGIDRVNQYLHPLGVTLTAERIYDELGSLGVRLGTFFYRQGIDIAKRIVQVVLGVLFWVLVLYYLLVDGERLRAWLEDVVPVPADQQRRVVAGFVEMARSLLIGNGLAGLIQGVIGGAVFALVDLPGPVLWGVVMGILAFIPVVGISFVYLPVTAVLLLAGETSRALWVLIPLLVVATVTEYFIKPALVGRRAHMHVLLVFLALIGGVDAFGVVGLLVGPLVMGIFLAMVEIYREHYRWAVPWHGEDAPAPVAASPQPGGAEPQP